MDYISTTPLYDSNYLAHHGIKGMKWGIRRYQNPDGTLTEEGRRKYGYLMNHNRSKFKGNSKEFLKKHKKAIIIGGAVALSGAAGIALARSKSGR